MEFPLVLTLIIFLLTFLALVIHLFSPSSFAPGAKKLSLITSGLAAFLSLTLLLTMPFRKACSCQFEWLSLPSLTISFGITLDLLSLFFMVLISLSLFILYLYCWREEVGRAFYGATSLMAFSSLGLVLAGDLFGSFFFWELLGLAGYLAIHLLDRKKENSPRSLLGFSAGSLAFLLALFVIFHRVESLGYAKIFESLKSPLWSSPLLSSLGTDWFGVLTLLFLLAIISKSAIPPLHIWVMDTFSLSMPLLGLVYSSTLTASGIYLALRLFPLFVGYDFLLGEPFYYLSSSLEILTFWGGLWALLFAFMALVQKKLSRVLIYGSLSQTSYLLMGIGIGAYEASLFHFFLSGLVLLLLFLCADSLVREAGSQKLKKILKKVSPFSFAPLLFLCGCLLLSGVFFFSAFYDGRGILAKAYLNWMIQKELISFLPFFLGLLIGAITVLYLSRVGLLIFSLKKDRAPEKTPGVQRGALLFLLLLCMASLGLFSFSYLSQDLTARTLPFQLLNPSSIGVRGYQEIQEIQKALPLGGLAFSLLVLMASSFALAWLLYESPLSEPRKEDLPLLSPVIRMAREGFYFESVFAKILYPFYLAVSTLCKIVETLLFHRWASGLSGWVKNLSYWTGVVDYHGLDRAMRISGQGVLMGGNQARKLQTGKIQDYIFLTLFLFVFIFILWAILLYQPLL